MHPGHEVRHRWRSATGHHLVRHFDHRDLQAVRDGDGSNLEPDVAGAHDDERGTGTEMIPDPVDVPDGAQVMHAREPVTGQLNLARPAARREDELVVVETVAAAELQPADPRLDPGHARAQEYLHLMLCVELFLAQQQPGDIHFPGQKLLRQGRPLVREIRLFADQDDAAREAVLAQRHGGLAGGVAGPGDHNGALHARIILTPCTVHSPR